MQILKFDIDNTNIIYLYYEFMFKQYTKGILHSLNKFNQWENTKKFKHLYF